MNRSWYWKVSFVAALALLALLYVFPTLVRERRLEEQEVKDAAGQIVLDDQGKPKTKMLVIDEPNLPDWYPDAFRKYITLGLDLQGGVLLQYGVDLFEALRGKADLYRDDVERQLTEYFKDEKGIDAIPIVKREGLDQIVITTEPPDQVSAIDNAFFNRPSFQALDQEKQGGGDYIPVFTITEQGGDRVVLEFSSAYQGYLERYALDQGIETISDRIDKLAVKEPEIRKGSSGAIVIQLPGLSEADFGQTQQIIEQTAQLQFKLVDDTNTEYLRKLQARIKTGSTVNAFTEGVGQGGTVTGSTVYFRADKKEDLEAFIHDVTSFGEEGRRSTDGSVYLKALGDIRVLMEKAGADEVKTTNANNDVIRIHFSEPTDPQVVKDALATYMKEKNTEVNAAILREDDFILQSEDGNPIEGPTDNFLISKSLRVPQDHELLIGEEVVTDAEGTVKEQFYRTYWLNRKTDLTGEFLTNASVNIDSQDQRPVVSFSMDSAGAKILARLSKENIGKRFAIILDGQVKSAPYFQGEIPNGRGQITLGSVKSKRAMMEEANSLSIVLQAGALPAPLSRQFVTQVGPQLGKAAVDQGQVAVTVGALLIVLFMLIYYKKAGLIADMALILNLLFIIAIMSALEATLTLPGIAAIVLVIGTAVDANILIFERIREELRLGKTPRQAIDSGYRNAIRAILDANTANLISALVLGWYGSGPVKGFAVTLLIGILTSIFTSTFVTRLVFQYIAQRPRLDRLSI